MNRSSATKARASLVLCAVAAFFYSATSGFSGEVVTNSNRTVFCVDALKIDFPGRLLLDSLQAIANSNAPNLFVMQRAEDASWQKALEKDFGKFQMISASDALVRFGANVPQVIYDSRQHWSRSLATTLAGVHHALLTDHPLDGHEIAFDCRNRWNRKTDAYRWALTNLLPRCQHEQLVYLDENLSFLRDYAMQQNLFVLNLDPLNDPEEIALLDDVLAKFPGQARAFGWASGSYARKAKGQNDVTVEFALVRRLSQRGLLLVPADFASNLSFYARTGRNSGPLQQRHLNRNLKLQPGKRYVLLVVSDGDNLQYDLGSMRVHWEKERPKVPVAWTLSPQWAEIGPAVLQVYYREAAERGGWDEFVTGPSGYAYVNPGSMPAAQLLGFVESTRLACQRADMTSAAILDDGSRPPAQVANFLRAYAAKEFNALWLIAMPKYIGAIGPTAFLNERFRLGRDNAAEIARQVKQVKTDNPCVMIYVDGWGNVGDIVRDFTRGLDDSCEIVSATEMADLVRQWVAASLRLRQITARPGALEGLIPVSNPDGEFAVVDRNGTRYWQATRNDSTHYFYLDASEAFRGSALKIELEYFDNGTGEISLDYDSTDTRTPLDGSYKRHPNIIHRTNTARWMTARFAIGDARFADRENGGTDFRFYNGGDDLLVRAVRARRVGP